MPICHFAGRNLWILKPTSLNRGRGIHVFKDLDTLKELINSYVHGKKVEAYQNHIENDQDSDNEVQQNKDDNYSPKKLEIGNKNSEEGNIITTSSFIIQKYIEKPLLIYFRKFDIRVWVLITQTFESYVFKFHNIGKDI